MAELDPEQLRKLAEAILADRRAGGLARHDDWARRDLHAQWVSTATIDAILTLLDRLEGQQQAIATLSAEIVRLTDRTNDLANECEAMEVKLQKRCGVA